MAFDRGIPMLLNPSEFTVSPGEGLEFSSPGAPASGDLCLQNTPRPNSRTAMAADFPSGSVNIPDAARFGFKV